MLELYSYFRSSAAYRVRIALNYKTLKYKTHAIHLVKNGGEQHSASYKAINPQQLVPTLLDNNQPILQSLSILEYLEEQYPEPPLLPKDPITRANIRTCAQMVACDIHPLNNLRVLNYLKTHLNVEDNTKMQWYHHWIVTGFTAIEKFINGKKFCFNDQVSMADICLIPQVYNALRFNVPMENFVKILSVYKHCINLPYFKTASPEQQPDAK